jgi:hypothetical protein
VLSLFRLSISIEFGAIDELASELLRDRRLRTHLCQKRTIVSKGLFLMLRLGILIAGLIGGVMIWPEIQADDRILWAAAVPAVYFIGMWALLDGRS